MNPKLNCLPKFKEYHIIYKMSADRLKKKEQNEMLECIKLLLELFERSKMIVLGKEKEKDLAYYYSEVVERSSKSSEKKIKQ